MVQSSQPPVANSRTPRDMVLSLIVLLVPVLLVVLIYRVVQGGDQPVEVDTAPAIAQARSANAFPVAEPAGLGEDWRAISATFQKAEVGQILRIGYVTPDGAGLQLIQSAVPPKQLLPAELTKSGKAEGTIAVDGQPWQRYTARPGERALVLPEHGRTIVIVGSAHEEEQRELAAAVR
ncbi:hypothetical protein GCM10022251_08920 [Phytohabitans flavus]|uniref:DUF4245 domain-containing protein n=1 Tax=Phytohabitans flavus TaxID=1076124 RepID=A0A6F8Y1D4_9ACTN|nr:DUF4245 domain-containing protein [Phytohabitans flavus]BCB79916.1 hypothetical protein Pflav_063260 [Phytohabitans flavus]